MKLIQIYMFLRKSFAN